MQDHEVIFNLKQKVKEEKKLTAKIITYLGIVNERRLYVEYGAPSLYKFCTRVLGYSDSEAYYRVGALKLTQKVPEVKEKLEDGSLTLSSSTLIESFLNSNTDADAKEVVDAVSDKSTRETKKILNELSTNPKPKSLKLNLNERLLNKLEMIQKDFDDCSELEAIEALMDKYIEAKKHAKPKRTARGSVHQRYITRSTKEFVDKRASGRCEAMWQGRRCVSRTNLQYDHIRPIAKGGQSTPENLRKLCFSCNQRAAIKNNVAL